MAHGGDDGRLLEKLLREIARAEVLAIEAPEREARRIGEAPPIAALVAVAEHAELMHGRFAWLLERHELALHLTRGPLGSTLSSLRHLVVDRVVNAERAYRSVLLELRHGLDVVKLLREIARREKLFGLIRWCDDWLTARRTLVTRAEAQLPWFVEQEQLAELRPTHGDSVESWEPIEER